MVDGIRGLGQGLLKVRALHLEFGVARGLVAQLFGKEAVDALQIAIKQLLGVCVVGRDHLRKVDERQVFLVVNLREFRWEV